jgi:hypothetical protein
VCRPGTVPVDTRDNLYQSLPPTIKAALRNKPAALKSNHEVSLPLRFAFYLFPVAF